MYTIRPLLQKDRERLTALILKLAAATGEASLLEAVSPSKEPNTREPSAAVELIGVKLFTALVEVLSSDVRSWFADLIGVSEAQFSELPFEIEFDIINQILSSETADRFLSHLSQLRKQIVQCKKRLSSSKEA